MQLPPAAQLPPATELPPVTPGAVDPIADAGGALASAVSALPLAPITLPAIVGPVTGVGGPAVAPRPGPRQAPNSSAASKRSQPSNRENPPAYSAESTTLSASFRAGYGEYLRTAGVPQMAAVAVPGVMGILALTAAGGLLGYRQARAGRTVRASGSARFIG
jgi:hypothetical protein